MFAWSDDGTSNYVAGMCSAILHDAKLYIATVCESKKPSGQSFFHVTDSDDASASSLSLHVDSADFIAEV